MLRVKRRRVATVTILSSLMLAMGAMPAFAHGGSVDPPSDQQECRNMDLNEKGEASNAEGGLSTAGDSGSAAKWDHCA